MPIPRRSGGSSSSSFRRKGTSRKAFRLALQQYVADPSGFETVTAITASVYAVNDETRFDMEASTKRVCMLVKHCAMFLPVIDSIKPELIRSMAVDKLKIAEPGKFRDDLEELLRQDDHDIVRRIRMVELLAGRDFVDARFGINGIENEPFVAHKVDVDFDGANADEANQLYNDHLANGGGGLILISDYVDLAGA